MTIGLRAEGFAAARLWLNSIKGEFTEGGAFGQSLTFSLNEMKTRAQAFTHVDTGTLRSAHSINQEGLRGDIFIAPKVNPVSGARASDYGPGEHSRGGSHAFYDRVYSGHSSDILNRAAAFVVDRISSK